MIFTDASAQGWALIWGIPRFQAPGLVQYRLQAPCPLFGAQGSNVSSTSLGSIVPVPPGNDCYGQHCCSALYIYQQAGGGAHSRSLLRLVVDIFLWIHTGHSGRRNNTDSPMVAISNVVSTLGKNVCESTLNSAIAFVRLGRIVVHLHAWRLSCSTSKQ